MERSSMNLYQLEYDSPWDMPLEIWWDILPGATLKRAQWVISNCADVPVNEIRRVMALQNEDIAQLDMSQRTESIIKGENDD